MMLGLGVCFAADIKNARVTIIRASVGKEIAKRIFVRFKRISFQNGINVLFLYLMRLKRKFALKSFFAICLHMCKKSSTFAANLKNKNDMDIKFDKRNYRKHSDGNKRKIKKSLQECGAGRSVLIDADDTLIAGNGVFEQAQAMGIPTRVIETDGTELVVVKRTDLRTDDDKRKLLAMADNATSDNVEWDFDNIGLDADVLNVGDWDIVVPETLSDEELNDLLVDAEEQEKDPKVTIIIPLCYEGEIEDIKSALQVTLEQWKGCKVK